MSTYTYVRYFTEDDAGIAEIREGVKKCEADFLERRRFLEIKAQQAVEHRLGIIKTALDLLCEPVPKPYGG
jgi:hypothetical protein